MAISLKQSKSLSPKTASRLRRQARGRKKIFGYPERPRLVVTKSSKHTLVQIVDDVAGRTLVSGSTMEAEFVKMSGDKSEKAAKLGAAIAERARQLALSRLCSTALVTNITVGSLPSLTGPAKPVWFYRHRRKG